MKYNESFVKGYITNESNTIGNWIEFPIENTKLNEILKNTKVNQQQEKYHFTSYECYPKEIQNILYNTENQSIETLNKLSKRLHEINQEDELPYLIAILELENCSNCEDILKYSYQMHNYIFWKGANDMKTLGLQYAEKCIYIPNVLEDYIDYSLLGNDVYKQSDFSKFSTQGYIEKIGNNFELNHEKSKEEIEL